MPTWKKIVTESTADNISQNAATATALATAQNFSITGEVTAAAISFDGTGAVAFDADVADGVIDTANFTAATLVTESEGIGNNDNDTTIATNAAIIDYVSSQVSAAGSGTITAIQIVEGNGINSTEDGNITSGDYTTTLSVKQHNGIQVDTDGVKARLDGTTLTFTSGEPAGQQKIIANTLGGIGDGNTNLVTGDQIYQYLDTNFSNNSGTVTSVAVTGTDGIQVDSGSPITTSGTITLGLEAGGVTNTSLENSSLTIGTTEISLGATEANIDGMSSIDGVSGGMDLGNVKSIQWDGGDVSLFTNLGNNNVTIGSNNSGYGVVIAGDLTVQGATTTMNVSEVDIEDKMLKLAHTVDDSNQSIAGATGGGIQLATNLNVNSSYWPEFRWTSGKGSGTDGQQTSSGLTGWSVSNARTNGASTDFPVAVMQFGLGTPDGTTYSAGVGSFFYKTVTGSDNDELYIRID
jgi:hypothetical protein